MSTGEPAPAPGSAVLMRTAMSICATPAKVMAAVPIVLPRGARASPSRAERMPAGPKCPGSMCATIRAVASLPGATATRSVRSGLAAAAPVLRVSSNPISYAASAAGATVSDQTSAAAQTRSVRALTRAPSSADALARRHPG